MFLVHPSGHPSIRCLSGCCPSACLLSISTCFLWYLLYLINGFQWNFPQICEWALREKVFNVRGQMLRSWADQLTYIGRCICFSIVVPSSLSCYLKSGHNWIACKLLVKVTWNGRWQLDSLMCFRHTHLTQVWNSEKRKNSDITATSQWMKSDHS